MNATFGPDRLQISFWLSEPNLHAELLRSLQVYYSRLSHVADSPYGFVLDPSLDSIVAHALSHPELDWLCIVGVGLIFASQDLFVEALQDQLRRADEQFGIFANYNAEGSSTDRRLVMLNLRRLRTLGGFRCSDYADELRAVATAHRMSCSSIDPRIFEHTLYAEPHLELDKLNHNLSQYYSLRDMPNINQRRLLGYLLNRRLGVAVESNGRSIQLTERTDALSVYNTDQFQSDPQWTAKHGRSIRHYLGSCTGFLDLMTLHDYGFDANTRLTYFDIHPDSLQFRKLLFEEFDGRLSTYGRLARSLLRRLRLRAIHWGNEETEQSRLLEVFGSERNFRKTWMMVQQCPREFCEINLLSQADSLFAKIKPDLRAVFAISDIFTGQNELTYGHSVTHAKFIAFLEAASRYPELVISGKDSTGLPFVCQPAADLKWRRLSQRN